MTSEGRLQLACFGSSPIVERAILRPNAEMGNTLDVEIVSRNVERHAALTAAYRLSRRRRTADDVLADVDVDAVYIALPNSLHAALALAALARGKAVLVEKPLGVTIEEVAALRRAASEGGRLVEAMMVQHHPWSQAIADWRSSGRSVSTTTVVAFPIEAERLARMASAASGGGVWYDIGAYWAYLLEAARIELSGTMRLVRERRSPSGFALSLDLEARSGPNVAKLHAALDESFQASHSLDDGRERVTIPNFLRPTVGDSAMMLAVSDRSGTTRRRWISGEGFYKAQLRSFIETIRGPRRETDLAGLRRAHFVAAVGESLASRDPKCGNDLVVTG